MATGLQFKENLTLISGGYPGENPGSSGVIQDWTDTTGTSGNTTTTYWYNDSALMTNANSTRVELNITDNWSAQLLPGNVYRITVTTVINSIRRYKVGNPQPLTVAIFARQTAGGPNIWTSGGCINAAIDATIATNVNMGTYYFDLPPESTGRSRGTVYYRSNICGHDGDTPPSIYVDEFWMGINFRNTLPPDYRPGQTWSNTGSSVQTVTGTSINVSNTLQSPFEDLKVGGDTEQTTYSGKNLLNVNFTSSTSGGVTITNNGDGTITASGTITGAVACNLSPASTNNLVLQNGRTYTQRVEVISGNFNFRVVPAFRNSGGTITYNYFVNNQSKTTTDTMTCGGYDIFTSPSYLPVGSSVNFTIRVWLEEGSDLSSPYEPYVGGTASPNPDYPQEVQTVTGEQTVTISDGQGNEQTYPVNLGKNLLDNYNPTVVSDNTTWTPTANGGLYTATSGWTGGVQWRLTVETGATYQFQYKERTDQNLYLYITTYTDSTYTTVKTRLVNDGRYTKYPIVPDSPYLEISFNNSSAMTNVAIEELMFEKASTRTTYAPYFTPIELCKIGTYQDYIYKSGDDWYVHKETVEMVLDGTETITKPFTNIFVVENLSGDWPKESEAVFYYCEDYYRLKSTGSNSNFNTLAADYGYAVNFTSSASGRNIRFKDTRYDNIDSYKAWLASNNVTVYYAIATPTDRQVLEPALIAQLNAIENGGSYTGTTTINVTGDLASPLTVGVRVATGSGTWQSHNRNGGWAGVYNGSTFKEMRTVNGPDGTGDPPTIKHPSGWKNQRKIGLNS